MNSKQVIEAKKRWNNQHVRVTAEHHPHKGAECRVIDIGNTYAGWGMLLEPLAKNDNSRFYVFNSKDIEPINLVSPDPKAAK